MSKGRVVETGCLGDGAVENVGRREREQQGWTVGLDTMRSKRFALESLVLVGTFAKYKTMQDSVQTPESEISSLGFVVRTLEATLWAFSSTRKFREGALKPVNLGDADDAAGVV